MPLDCRGVIHHARPTTRNKPLLKMPQQQHNCKRSYTLITMPSDCRGVIHHARLSTRNNHARLAAGATRPSGQEPLRHQSETNAEPTPCNRNCHCGRDLSRPYSPSNTQSDCRDAIHRVRPTTRNNHARLAAGATRPGGQEPPHHQSGTNAETTPCNRTRRCGRDLSRPYHFIIIPLDCRGVIHRVRPTTRNNHACVINPKYPRSSIPPPSSHLKVFLT